MNHHMEYRGLSEKETIILFNESEPIAEVYSFNNKIIKLLQEMDRKELSIQSFEEGGPIRALLPKSWVKIRASRVLTPNQLQELRQRAKKMNQKKNP